ncbi:MAG TPA: cache domain-containing protein, partial [Petrotogaceae bacterium]|nr:cache domain-containing protein [Petrotogaceae bacterium]
AFIGLPDGSILVKPEFDIKPDYNATIRPWYTAAIDAHGKTAVSDPYIDYITNDYSISVTRNINDKSGKFVGVAGTNFKTDFLIDNLVSESIYGTVQSFVINSKGIMIIHPEKNLLSTNLSFHEIFEKSSEQEGTFAASFMGINYFVSYKKIPQINWIFFTVTERSNIVSPVLDAFIKNILTFILLQILTIIIIETIVYESSQPFADLIKSMKNFAQSKDFILDESLKNVKDYEVKNLVKHYSSMAEEIYATLEELRASNEELMSAYESIEQSYDYFSNKMLEMVDGYDENTGNHIERVGILSEFIATKLGLSIDLCNKIRKYSPLHDIGKISIPQSILLKPGKLDDSEW